MIKSLLERAEIYHAQDRYPEALQDVKDAVYYMAVERRTLREVSSSIVRDDIKLIEKLALRSRGTLRDAFNELCVKAISIRKKLRTGDVDSILGPYEDLDAEDLAAARGGDFAFEDWDEEGEVGPVFAGDEEEIERIVAFRTGKNVLDERMKQYYEEQRQADERQKNDLKKQLTESDAYVFPLGRWSDNLLLCRF